MNENEKMPIIRGRILGILFKSEHSMEETEIIEAYLINWEEENQKLIIRALDDLVSRGYLNYKISYGRRFYWLTPKGKKFILNVIAGSVR